MKTDSRVIANDNIADKTKIGYIRVSSAEQNEARQLEAFKDLGLYKIYIEKLSAKNTDRPLLKQLLDYVREGDTVYIKDFSRIARSTKDLLEITEELNNRRVKLISLKENLDTSTATGENDADRYRRNLRVRERTLWSGNARVLPSQSKRGSIRVVKLSNDRRIGRKYTLYMPLAELQVKML